jgi:hypothetical protein
MTLTPTCITSRIFLLAVVAFALAIIACGGEESVVPTATPSDPGTGPQTTEEAIQHIRDYLAVKNFEGENCLTTLENATLVQWSAIATGDFDFSVTLSVNPPKLLHNVHTWAVGKRAGRVEPFRPTC